MIAKFKKLEILNLEKYKCFENLKKVRFELISVNEDFLFHTRYYSQSC